jgi:hypothetical protein
MVKATLRPFYPREWDSVPTVQEDGWDPGPVWTGAESLAPSLPSGFDPRTLQPVASRYTVTTTPPTLVRSFATFRG